MYKRQVPIESGSARLWFGAISRHGDYILVLQDERVELQDGQIVRVAPPAELLLDRKVR